MPPENANGSGYASFGFKVNDGDADSGAVTMTVDVTAVNDAPAVANAIPDQSATVGTSFSYQFPANTFSDVDNDTPTYTATKDDGAALSTTWLSFAAATRTFSGTPQAADVGTLSVKVTASDSGGGTAAEDTFEITVRPATPAHCDTSDADELWCASMTVGVASEAGTNAVIFRGYDAGLPAGSLTPRTFPWRAVTIGVGQLVLRVDRTELVFNISLSSGTLPSDGLLGPGGFSLEIGTGADKSAFAIVASASTDNEQEFNWPNSGLSWSENDVVPVRLLRAPLPTAADSEVSTPEDTDYVFGADDFAFSDANTGDTLANVKVASLPARGFGALEFDGAALASGDLPQTVTKGELDAGKLVFSPVAGQLGDDYASFDFKVSDGVADSAAYAMTVDVEADPAWSLLVDNLVGSTRLFYRPVGNATNKLYTQRFHTGDEPGGYELRSVGIRLARNELSGTEGFNLWIYDSNADGTAKDVVHRLTTPWVSGSEIPTAEAWFTAPAATTLEAGTDYHVAFQGSGQPEDARATVTADDAQTGESDWSIEDVLRRNGILDSFGDAFRIAVRGRVNGVTFLSGAYIAIEGGSHATVTVRLAPTPSAPVQIPLTVKSYDGGATAADHSALPESLGFPTGVSSKTFTVAATDDAINDDGESLTLGFGDLPEGYEAGATATATISLADDEETVSFGADAYTATENGTAATVAVTLSAASSAPVEVALTATRNGATAATDYSGVPATLTFAATETSRTFTVTATNDAVDDDGESVTLGFDSLPGNYGRGAVPETTVSLADNDAPAAMNGRVTATADTDYTFSTADFEFVGWTTPAGWRA